MFFFYWKWYLIYIYLIKILGIWYIRPDKWIFSKLQCGFRKGHSAQHCLLVLIEKCRKILDKRGFAVLLLTDLRKAFDCIDHELLIAKLHAFGFNIKSLELIHNYLHDRIQRVKIHSSFSHWSNLACIRYTTRINLRTSSF